MSLVLLFAVVTALLLILPGVLYRYVRHLPDAPLCPGCRALTSSRDESSLTVLLLPTLAATVLRECGRCGWRGRMRLRLAPESASKG